MYKNTTYILNFAQLLEYPNHSIQHRHVLNTGKHLIGAAECEKLGTRDKYWTCNNDRQRKSGHNYYCIRIDQDGEVSSEETGQSG